MKTVFASKLEPLLGAVAEQMELYVPQKSGDYYVFRRYDRSADVPVELNNIRTCTPVKEFLFPLRETAAVYPEPIESEQVKPFAVFGLKQCDLRSMAILDKVFKDDEFKDPSYIERREKMFIIASDCSEPGESCFCNILDGKAYASSGFDLNVSKVRDGFIVEAGSDKGDDFIEKHSQLFSEAPEALLTEREQDRAKTQQQREKNNAELQVDAPLKEIFERGQDADGFDIEAKTCIECQACTRICPTCHCFYLYDATRGDYFAKMKMWDSCMRMAYAEVAGGANPNKVLGDRLKHRLFHKFVYFLDRYGLEMCVGCGRCVDADAGGIDIRQMFKKLNEELQSKDKAEVAK